MAADQGTQGRRRERTNAGRLRPSGLELERAGPIAMPLTTLQPEAQGAGLNRSQAPAAEQRHAAGEGEQLRVALKQAVMAGGSDQAVPPGIEHLIRSVIQGNHQTAGLPSGSRGGGLAVCRWGLTSGPRGETRLLEPGFQEAGQRER